MKKLLQVIRQNDEKFDEIFPLNYFARENYQGNVSEIEFSMWQEKETNIAKTKITNIKSYFRQSRIKELEVVVETIEKEIGDWNAGDEYYSDVTDALTHILEPLKDTIEKLKGEK